jgi:hypothetical protein
VCFELELSDSEMGLVEPNCYKRQRNWSDVSRLSRAALGIWAASEIKVTHAGRTRYFGDTAIPFADPGWFGPR